jgi:hypothetical protein
MENATSSGSALEEAATSASALQEAATELLTKALGYAPSLIAALTVLLIGWLIARLARNTTRQIGSGINRILDTVFRHGALSSARLSTGGITLLSEVVFWVFVFMTLTIAARIAQFPAISAWLNQIVSYLPNLLIGAGIVVAGYFISVIAGDEIASSARAAKAPQGALMGRLAQSAIFATALIIGLDQMGVDVTFLVALFVVSIGAVLAGFSIAFGLGARSYVSNLIAARTARQELAAGVLVRIGECEGEVLEITQTQIALDTADGRVLVPAHMAQDKGILIVSREAAEGGNP